MNLGTDSYSKPNSQSILWGLMWSPLVVTLCFIHLSTWPQIQNGGLHQVPLRSSATWMKMVAVGRPYIWQQNSAQAEEISPGCEKISTTTPTNFRPPNSLDGNPLDYYMCNMIEQETNKIPRNTKNELKARIMVAVTYLNK